MDNADPIADMRQYPDPRAVVALFISGALWIGSCRTLLGAVLWVLIAVSAAMALRRQTHSAIGRGSRLVRWAVPMAVVVALMNAIFQSVEGRVLGSMGPIRISQDGLITGARLGLRLIAFAGLTEIGTTLANPSGMAAGITRLLIPLRVIRFPVASVYYLMFFILRMYPLLSDELQTIRLGQRSRGVRFDGPWSTRIRMSTALIVPAFAAALRRSDRLSDALASRGFDVGRVPAGVMSLHFATRDWMIVLLVAACWIAWLAGRLEPVDLWLF